MSSCVRHLHHGCEKYPQAEFWSESCEYLSHVYNTWFSINVLNNFFFLIHRLDNNESCFYSLANESSYYIYCWYINYKHIKFMSLRFFLAHEIKSNFDCHLFINIKKWRDKLSLIHTTLNGWQMYSSSYNHVRI